MKTLKLFLGLVLSFLMGCSSKQSTYEKTIADFIQTDRHGTKYDMKFKVLEFKEIKRMTVADSIQYLKDKIETKRADELHIYEKLVAENQDKYEKADKSKDFVDKYLKKNYEENVAKYKKEVEHWKKWNPDWLDAYKEASDDKLLSIIIYCKYSAVPPMLNTTIEEARYFVLSPDGKTCYKKMKELE